jgi:hypothetical protein
MTESISTQLVTLLSEIIPLNLAEAATEEYPYAVYDQTLTYNRTKDGVYAITADTDIHIYGKDFSVVEGKAALIITTLEEDMRNDTYVATLRTVNRDCVNEVWDIQLNYTIKQLK